MNVHGDEEIAAEMLEQLKRDNVLRKYLNELEKQKLLKWNKHDGIFCLFPSLTSNDINKITFGITHVSLLFKIISLVSGSYQIHRAKSYIQDHLKPTYYNPDELAFHVEIPEGFDNLVRARFQSAHSTRKSYISTIQFDNNKTDDPIQGWCCSCTIGLRVVGCCSHVCALLWHLGVNRGITSNISNPLSASHFTTIVHDSPVFSDNDDYSDDDDNNIKYSLNNDSTDTSNDEQPDSSFETEEE